MSLREAAEMALLCLETSRVFVTSRERIKRPEGEDFYDEAINALRAALAEAESSGAEPVATYDDEVLFVFDAAMQGRHWWTGGTWLYPGDTVVVRRAAAPARKAESAVNRKLTTELSDEEILSVWRQTVQGLPNRIVASELRLSFARAVLAAARGKG